MSYTAVQREKILSMARANLSARSTAASSHQGDIVHKDNHDGVVDRTSAAAEASAEQQPWQDWVDRFVDDRLMESTEWTAQEVCKLTGEIWRELKLLREEFTVLREQVGLERGLRDLRTEVEQARADVPKVPALVAQLQKDQTSLQREVKTTQQNLKTLRVDQYLTDRRLSKLSEATKARSAEIEMKIETTVSSFEMREVHPAARAAMRDYAAEHMESYRRNERILFRLDPGPAVGVA